ncbi:alpha/beta fold hydrolase [Salinicola acroporae]|uniref:Alpha/beta hydrolase n=1 Tax=Salinicola acroporae TaxID=1541440 RepID=A0ABT6I5D1_9GAMM|nr:alpha/beta hydrolase [Salinicola acroporae]MDH4572846.1 alpha/beta hydrolase [Salinicola acroporae]
MNSSAHYLDIDGRPGFVMTFGSGKPVVCIHTAGQSALQWQESIKGLVEGGYQAIIPDLPGHGHSEEPATGPVEDLEYYASWIIEVIERLELDRPYVVGCSIGGKITLSLGVRYAAKLSGIVAMAADALNDGQSERALRKNLQDSVSPSRSDRTYYGTLAACGASVSKKRVERIAARHRREDPQVALRDLIGWARHDISGQLDRITCPAHLIVGDDDFWLSPQTVEATAREIPHGRYTRLEGIGHYPMEEIADFGSQLVKWLSEL